MKRFMIFILLCLFLTSCTTAKNVTVAEPVLTPAGINLDTAVAQIGSVRDINIYSGYVKTASTALSFGQTSLRIKKVNYAEGDYVKKGDVIASLDVEGLENEIQKQQKTIEKLERRYAYENETMLCDLEIVRLELTTASDKSKKQNEITRLEMKYRHALESQAIELEWQSNRLAELEKNLENMDLIAPFDGRLVKLIDLMVGNTVKPFVPVAYISDERELYIKYEGTDYYANTPHINLIARVGGEIFSIVQTEVSYDNEVFDSTAAKPTFFKFVGLSDDELKNITPGQSVLIERTLSEINDVLVIPVNTLYSSDGALYVYVVKDGKSTFTTIKAGARNSSFVQILEGLAEGDEVVVKQ